MSVGEMRVGDAIADAVCAEGVTAAFGLLGEGNIAVVERLSERGDVEWIAGRREDAAVCMADGYARRAGGLGFATVTHGPGVTNALTALTEAARARTSLVVLAGDTAAEDFRHAQATEERAFIEPTGAGIHVVRSSATAIDDVAIVFGRARSEQRPIVLMLPTDLADAPYRGPPITEVPMLRGATPPQQPTPDPQAVAAVAQLLQSVRRPVVLVGRGAIGAGARDDIAALAVEIGAPIVTTLLARGAFASDPWHAGVVGGFGCELANEIVGNADVVLAFGASLSDFTSKGMSLFRPSEVIQFNTVGDIRASSGERPLQLVLGDAGASAAALIRRLRASSIFVSGWRTPELHERLASHNPNATFVDESGRGRMDSRTVGIELDAMLPKDRGVVVDLGYFTAEACKYVDVTEPRSFALPCNFGSIGLALATAAGASVVDRGRITAALVGDGGLMTAIGELETLRRHKLPVAVIVFNDSSYGIEYHALRVRGREPRLAVFDEVDFAAVARGFGVRGVTVKTADDLRALAGSLVAGVGPILVDVKVDGTIETPWLHEIIASGWHRHVDQ